MGTDLADRLGAAPELRLASYTYRELFGHPPAGVWHAPGTVTLLADGPLRLTVAARWGAIVAAAPRGDGVIEAIRMNRPDERVHLTLAEAAAGAGPSWAGTALRGARAGATLLVNTDLPDGSGLGSAAATETAIGLALEDLVPGDTAAAGDRAGAAGPVGHRPGRALLGDRGLPFDLSAAGLRLMVIDTRVRDLPQPPIVEHSSVTEAAAALEAGAFEALGPMLTAAHAALADALAATVPAGRSAAPAADGAQQIDDVQQIAVSAALDGGALGARMLVDGPGRPACALLRAPVLTDVRRAITAAFSARRLRAPRLLTIEPAAGPRRHH
jgi:galactokinase